VEGAERARRVRLCATTGRSSDCPAGPRSRKILSDLSCFDQ
jgi:hypothetical protein